jgi:hypothetical protein
LRFTHQPKFDDNLDRLSVEIKQVEKKEDEGIGVARIRR